jgi:hypothetical protein
MDWTHEEIIVIVADYFDMLKLELNSLPYSKTEHRRKTFPLLNNRTEGSIEAKHRNISAVLVNMGLPYIKGYKPYFNYQKALEKEVALAVEKDKRSLKDGFQKFVDKEVALPTKGISFENLLDDGPEKMEESIVKEPSFLPININYLVKEQKNRNLGEEGEQLVFNYEKWRLTNAGKENLADKIEWVSKDKGDGMGYDILSKNDNGTDRFIEVKTTKLAKETPFYFSRTEWKFASSKKNDFFLYRVFNFGDKPQLFIKQGKYEDFCKMEVQNYKGYF